MRLFLETGDLYLFIQLGVLRKHQHGFITSSPGEVHPGLTLPGIPWVYAVVLGRYLSSCSQWADLGGSQSPVSVEEV